MIKKTFVDRLNKIRELNGNKSFVNKDLYKLLIREDAIIAGYESIKNKKLEENKEIEENKKKVNKEFKKKLSNCFLEPKCSLCYSVQRVNALKNSLKTEAWSPSPTRGSRGYEEKVVQSTIKLILNAIYEPTFSPQSFERISVSLFRPKKEIQGIQGKTLEKTRGAHDALKKIEEKYDGMTFAIKGNIKGMYSNVNHHLLISLLQKRISDTRFIRLIWKFLRAGCMDNGQLVISSNIVSPILANIYLHEFDKFMLEKKQQKGIIKEPKTYLTQKMKKEIEGKLSLKKYKKTKMESLNKSEKIWFTRYADNFIIGIAGSIESAESLKEEIRIFLKTLNLTINVENRDTTKDTRKKIEERKKRETRDTRDTKKSSRDAKDAENTKIYNLKTDYAMFLGHQISIGKSVKLSFVSPLKKSTSRLAMVTAPINKIIAKLNKNQFCDSKGNPTPNKVWSTQEDNHIIRMYNVTFRNIFGYYSGVQKKRRLSRIKYIMKFSCALTLAFKKRISLNKVFIRYGQSLKICYGNSGKESIDLFSPDLKEGNRKWQTGRELPNPYKHVATKLTKTKPNGRCCICECTTFESR